MTIKSVAMVLLIILFLPVCKAQTNPKVWTEKYEQKLYDYLDSVSKPSMPDNIKRTKYVKFYVFRVKQETPNGINSVSKDSLQNLNIRIGREYAIKASEEGIKDAGLTPSYAAWTPIIEKTFIVDLFTVFKNNGIKINDKFCDCIIENLKKIYPDSILLPTPKEIMSKVAANCKNKIGLN